ncbi:MAG: hypothetical protein AAGI08_07855, partial [Bacteroidota bacterium]
RALTERLVTTSGVTAQEVAQYTLRAAGNRKIHILYPRQSALLWRLKRLAPTFFMNRLLRTNQKVERYLSRSPEEAATMSESELPSL